MLALFAAPALAAFPEPEGPVTDAARVLSPAARAHVEATIRDTERQTTAEIAVATIPSLDGISIEEYANKLFAAWGIGKKQADNGVLLLVAVGDHRMRIEVGYGLEGVLPDGLAGDIIRTQLTPAFKAGDFSRGISDGVDRIATIVREHHVLTPEEAASIRRQQADGEKPPMLFMIPFFGLFILVGCASIGSGVRVRATSPILFGMLFAGIPAGMALIPFFNTPIWILGPLGALAFVWGYRKGASPAWAARLRGTGASDGGWVSGSMGSGSGGSGSFGGGSSGGGGASGSW